MVPTYINLTRKQPIPYTRDMTDLLDSDTFVNPFLRIREENNLTQLQLQRDLGFTSAQVIRRTEQGLYNHPTPRITQYLADIAGVDFDFLQREYALWQTHVRKQAHSIVSAGLQYYCENPQGFKLADVIKCIAHFCESPSRMSFCKLLCINPAQIDPVAGRRELPDFIKDAFREAKISDIDIDRVGKIMAFGRRL